MWNTSEMRDFWNSKTLLLFIFLLKSKKSWKLVENYSIYKKKTFFLKSKMAAIGHFVKRPVRLYSHITISIAFKRNKIHENQLRSKKNHPSFYELVGNRLDWALSLLVEVVNTFWKWILFWTYKPSPNFFSPVRST